MTAPGVHISFFEAGEAADRELPAIGPLHGVLVRGDRVVIDHADVAVPDQPGIAVTRWLEGVVEMQRATGETAGGRRRKSMRVSAPDGLYLRFGAVGEPAASLREVGPFVVVMVGPRTIEAGGEVLATRLSGEGGMWTLTAKADPSAAGAQRPDVGFRSASTPYHPWMSAGPAVPAQTPKAPVAPLAPIPAGPAPTPTVAAPPPPSQRALKDSDLDLLERRARRQNEDEARAEERDRKLDAALSAADERAAANARYADAVREEAHMREAALREAAASADAAREAAALDKKRGKRWRGGGAPKAAKADKAPKAAKPRAKAPQRESVASRRIRVALASTGAENVDAGGTNWLELAWRLRFVMLALVVLGAGIYVFAAAQPRSVTGQPQEHTYNLGQKISGVRWDYVVNGIQREPLAGTARARGIYLAVRVTLTNKGAAGSEASPNDFALVDAAGTRYSPESLQSGVYASPNNRSPFEWPTTYPPGRSVTTRVVFDIDSTLTGLQFAINELPGTKVKIE